MRPLNISASPAGQTKEQQREYQRVNRPSRDSCILGNNGEEIKAAIQNQLVITNI